MPWLRARANRTRSMPSKRWAMDCSPGGADGVGQGVDGGEGGALLLADLGEGLAVLGQGAAGAERLGFQVPQPALVVHRRLIAHARQCRKRPARRAATRCTSAQAAARKPGLPVELHVFDVGEPHL